MALTPAERQRRYRQNRAEANSGEGERRLNTWLSTAAVLALKRLSAYESTSQRVIIERLILQADQENLNALHGNDAGFEHYLNRSWPKGMYRPESARETLQHLIREEAARETI